MIIKGCVHPPAAVLNPSQHASASPSELPGAPAPLHGFLLELISIWKGFVIQGSNQDFTKVVPISKKNGKNMQETDVA